MKRIILGLALFALPAASFASTIAIVDSGSDYKHVDLVGQYQINQGEIAGNKIDDDKNGMIDDVFGWDFAENKADVIDYSYLARLKPIMPDVHKLFEIQTHALDGTATQADKDWYNSKIKDEKFLKELEVFGNFAHGTHVAGISEGFSTTLHKDSHPFAVKLIPTEVKLPGAKLYMTSPTFASFANKMSLTIPTAVKEMGFSLFIRFYVKLQGKLFGQIGSYVNARGADVANCSWGTGYGQAKTIVQTLYNAIFKENERSDAKLAEFTSEFMQQMLIQARNLVTTAPNTLYVIAAGNDGSDNTAFPASPANLREDNTITVAATLRNRELAVFSNYGTMVDVAAPGVGILSLYPGDDHGQMSGTSQAAPYVTSVAAEIKNQNPKLTPAQIKQIITGTVDTKDWLVGKVTTSGIVNSDRAFTAAALSKDLAINEAIDQAHSRVKDQETEPHPAPKPATLAEDALLIPVAPLPSPFN